jgi:hypothetical protein
MKSSQNIQRLGHTKFTSCSSDFVLKTLERASDLKMLISFTVLLNTNVFAIKSLVLDNTWIIGGISDPEDHLVKAARYLVVTLRNTPNVVVYATKCNSFLRNNARYSYISSNKGHFNACCCITGGSNSPTCICKVKTINTTLQEFLQSYGQSYNHLLAQTKISTINKFYKEKKPINLQICQVYYNNAKKVLGCKIARNFVKTLVEWY